MTTKNRSIADMWPWVSYLFSSIVGAILLVLWTLSVSPPIWGAVAFLTPSICFWHVGSGFARINRSMRNLEERIRDLERAQN